MIEIRNQQFQLLRRIRDGNVDPNADEGAELEPLYEEDEDNTPTCQDPNSKIKELNKEIFQLHMQNEQLHKQVGEMMVRDCKIDEIN
ncbi:putative Bracovirus protein MdBV-19-3 [Microplitis demolitor]